MIDLAWLIPAFPVAGFILLLLFGKRFGEPFAGWLATLACFGAFASTLAVFVAMLGLEGDERFRIVEIYEWITVGEFSVDVGLLIDPLSITMCLFITGVGSLIHLYSIGYMHGDANFSKFFTYLNAFVSSMLLLVLGDNLLLTFLGWEGVGACSYLLISFWFTNPDNASAGKKAFVTNRVGDVGFMLGTFLIFTQLGSINYDDIVGGASGLSTGVATVAVLLFLVAAAGKSAQLPLYVWLPDAMAGPTPVSALIHAATMVTSGVFLLTRLNPVLAQAEVWSLGIVAWLGALTALFAATAAVAQTDIKKVLAYSTVSQLGYLFLAVGVGGYVPAIFHMITHAFFKALLFLGSGSVIHGLHDEQDMRRMGGLRAFMPVTAFTFILGWLAIAGVPPFSGFWSKDEILLYAWNADAIGGKGLWLVGLLTALLTAFYMTRQVILTFFGRTRFFDPTADEIDEAVEARKSAGTAEIDDAVAAQEKAQGTLEKALADVTKKEEALVTARSKLDEATAAVEGSSEEADGYDKLVKALDKATKAVPKAETALSKAQDKAASEQAAVSEANDLVATARRLSETLDARLSSVPRPSEYVTAKTQATDVGDLAEHLPESYRHRQEYHPHESPWTMTTPLVVLSFFAVVAGFINLPFSEDLHFLGHWLEPSMFGNKAKLDVGTEVKWILAFVAIGVAAVAILAAFRVYMAGKAVDPKAIERKPLANAWYVDKSFAKFMGGPGRAIFDAMSWFDRTIVDGAVRGVAGAMAVAGDSIRILQTGFVRSYALIIAMGSVLMLVWFVLWRLYL